jgi:hypothetical protein
MRERWPDIWLEAFGDALESVAPYRDSVAVGLQQLKGRGDRQNTGETSTRRRYGRRPMVENSCSDLNQVQSIIVGSAYS